MAVVFSSAFSVHPRATKNETKINSTVPTAETVWNSQSRGRHRPEAGTAGLCFAAKQRGPARPDTRGAPASSLSPFTSRPHWQRRRIAVGEPLGRPSAAARGTPDAGGDGLLMPTLCTEAARLDLRLQAREGGTRRTTGMRRCSGETAAPGAVCGRNSGRGWTVNEIPSTPGFSMTVGLDTCGQDLRR